MSKSKRKHLKQSLILFIIAIIITILGYFDNNIDYTDNVLTSSTVSINLENIPEYTGSPYVEIDNNIPSFKESDYTTNAFETYSNLDNFGRCGVAYANICKEVMPPKDAERESISRIKANNNI